MNKEQRPSTNGSENDGATGKGSVTTGSNTQSQPTPGGGGSAETQDEYYAVDHAKKDVISTIGDGEMHDEGLAGAGDIPTDIQSSTERLSDEQDQAELHDSEQ